MLTIDKVKLGLAALLVVAGIAAYHALGEAALVLRIAALLAGVAAAVAVAWASAPGKEFFVFAQESAAETKKVVWPSRKETLQTTGIVIAFVIVMALFLWAVDALLLLIVNLLSGRSE